MSQTITKVAQSREEVFIEFTPEEMDVLGIAPGDKFTVDTEDGTIILKKHVTVPIDLSDFSQEALIALISRSIEDQVPCDEVFSRILSEFVESHRASAQVDDTPDDLGDLENLEDDDPRPATPRDPDLGSEMAPDIEEIISPNQSKS